MALGRLKLDRAAGDTVPLTGPTAHQAAVFKPLPIVGEGDDGGALRHGMIVAAAAAATQPPASKLHALERFTHGARRARTRSSELELGSSTVQGGRQNGNVSRAPRVGYKKSRKGCAQCKRRHVKCNEEAPCSNCIRHSVACSLAGGPNVPRDDAKPKQRSPATSVSSLSTRTSSYDATASSTTVTASTRSTTVGASPVDSNEFNSIRVLTGSIDRNAALTNQAWMLDLELMHHFTAFSNDIMTEHFDLIGSMWQHEMPRIAFRSQYVMHGLLGFSALHLASLQPERALLLRASATNHLDQALVLYRQDSGPATAENADARFSFSWLVALFAFAIPPSVPPIEAMVELFSLVRGIEVVLQETLLWIMQGPLAPILTRTFIENKGLSDDGTALSMAFAFEPSIGHSGSGDCVASDTLPEGMEFGLNHLDFMIGMHSMVPEERRTCVLILAELKQLYSQVLSSRGGCGMSMIMCFPKQDPTRFSLLLKRRHPQALVILAHYTVLLDMLDSRWWARGWGRRVLRDVVGSLGDEWKSWIEWPVQTVLMKQASLSPVVSLDASMLGCG